MSNRSYKELWHTKIKDELPEFKEILSWDDLFEEWDRDSMPEVWSRAGAISRS